ncbi:MAG: CPBP family intramembrane metalloprotease [Spirochaetaceae bacterium]|nr:CPBP family intramembrane metalloprotease [Spirochaetaceae bacterium]
MKQCKLHGFPSLLLLVAAYMVTWADLFVPLNPFSAFSSQWLLVSIGKNSLRILMILVLGHYFSFSSVPSYRSLFPKDPGAQRSRLFPEAKDMLDGLIIAGVAFGLVLLSSLIMMLFHFTNPLMLEMSGKRVTPQVFLELACLSFTVGYSEELFFRCFAEESFRNIGLPPYWAMGAGALLFGLSHGAQGLGGMFVAALLGLAFSLFRKNGKSLHALALGHALYDFITMLAAFNL